MRGRLAVGAVVLLSLVPSLVAADGGVVVPMQGKAFQPVEQTVPVGTTVTWVNQDAEDHDVYSDDGSVSSPSIPPGGSWSFTFAAPGTVHYICDLHEGMSATVVVTG
jgi:plastocyanin